MTVHLITEGSGHTVCRLPRESGRRITTDMALVTCDECRSDPFALQVKAAVLEQARQLGRELKADRAAYGAKSRTRAVAVRALSQVFGMTQREIATELDLSNPRVCEIINGPRKRKPKAAGQETAA